MKFRKRTLDELADMICGNFPQETRRFKYRSSSYLTQFFADCDLDFVHDGSTRKYWVAEQLEQLLAGPQSAPTARSDAFARFIKVLMDPADAENEGTDRGDALAQLNTSLSREGYEAF